MRSILCAVLLASCSDPKKPVADPGKRDGGSGVATTDGSVTLPPAPPVPTVPDGLPKAPDLAGVTPEAVALGELLFFDPRLSSTGALACADCHVPKAGFSGEALAETATGKANLRRTPTLVNLAWHDGLAWDGRFGSFAELIGPHAQGQLGLDLADAVARIAEVPGYRAHFTRAGGASAATAHKALEAFVMTRYAGDAPWDRVERSPDAPADIKAGYLLFTNKAQCGTCHPPPHYTDHRYHRLGLIASPDEGRGKLDPAQKGAFKTPTVRGAAVREAFFHDASAKSLDAAIDWHLAGGTGQGADPSIVDPALKKVSLSPKEREQLGAFVRSLTDVALPAPPKPALP
jgi:cytochrome c peroxidase